jgi:hypothetical protein
MSLMLSSRWTPMQRRTEESFLKTCLLKTMSSSFVSFSLPPRKLYLLASKLNKCAAVLWRAFGMFGLCLCYYLISSSVNLYLVFMCLALSLSKLLFYSLFLSCGFSWRFQNWCLAHQSCSLFALSVFPWITLEI